MGGRVEELHAALANMAEELADLAFDRLREATESSEPAERDRLVGEERRLTRARRAVEKAAALLDPSPLDGPSPG